MSELYKELEEKKLNELSTGELKILYFNSNSKAKKDIRTELKCRGKYRLYISKDEMIDVLNDRINKAIEVLEENINNGGTKKVGGIENYLLNILKGER